MRFPLLQCLFRPLSLRQLFFQIGCLLPDRLAQKVLSAGGQIIKDDQKPNDDQARHLSYSQRHLYRSRPSSDRHRRQLPVAIGQQYSMDHRVGEEYALLSKENMAPAVFQCHIKVAGGGVQSR